MDFKQILDKLPKMAKPEKRKESKLRIDCGKCDRQPEYGNAVCIRCISKEITDDYRPEAIILDSGVEHEYTGEAARLMCDLSRCVPHQFPELKEKKCTECKNSPSKIDDEMWNLFSIDAIDLIISRLNGTIADDKDCDRCIVDTKTKMQETRNRLLVVSKEAMDTSYRLGGV